MKLNEITLEVTQQCPNYCIYCSSLSDMTKTGRLEYATLIKVIDDAALLGAKSVILSGGEPFLRKDIVEIVNHIYAKGLKVLIYSSGIYREEDGCIAIPKSILSSLQVKLDEIIFNYETIHPVLYSTIMGNKPSGMQLLDETITTAVGLNIPVEVHLVPMRCNFKQIPEVLDKVYAMGVKKVSFLRLVPQGRVLSNREMILLGYEEQEELKQILDNCQSTYQDKIRLGLPFAAKCSNCGTGTNKLTVRYDGHVFPCEAFKDGMMEIEEGITPDNVKEKSLRQIYEESPYLMTIRKWLESYQGCENSEHCFGQHCRKVNKKNEKYGRQ